MATPWLFEPAQRVGAFFLGMDVNEALSVVQKMGSLDAADLSFDHQRFLDTDLCLRLPSLGLQLCFDGFQQDLRVISVCFQLAQRDSRETESDVSSSGPFHAPPMLPTLSYNSRTFAGAQCPPLSFREVYTMFGPTWIGDFETNGRATYLLRYPGLTFEFLLPEDMVESLMARGEHPIEIPGRSPPTVSRMWIFAAEAPSFLAPRSARLEDPETVVVRPASGVELNGRRLHFGSMPQDVFSDFGPPEKVCVKDVDAVRIHSGRAVPSRLPGPDYYYNYFRLGLDVLFDGRSHLVKKIILHTNPPTHELFSLYTRCFFQIPFLASCGPTVGAVEDESAAGTIGNELFALRESEVGTHNAPCRGEDSAEACAARAPAARGDGERDAAKAQAEEGDGEDEVDRQGGRARISKRERKAQRKSKRREPGAAEQESPEARATPDSQVFASPPPSREVSPAASPDASPQASPLGGEEPAEAWDALLPPPALPTGAEACRDCIDVRWPWQDIREALGRSAGLSCGKPLVVNQGSHTPFSNTYFYAFPGLIFEVMSNGFVASLTVFSAPQEDLHLRQP